MSTNTLSFKRMIVKKQQLNNFYDDYEKIRNQLELELNLNKKAQKCSNNNQTTKCFCQNLFESIEQQSPIGKELFSYLKPLILGKILYAPNTSYAYNELIKRMNTTFSNIAHLSDLLSDLSSITNKTFDQYLNKFNSGDNNDLLINKIKTNIKFVSDLTKYASSILKCYDTNKFIGFKSEKEAVEYGSHLMENKTFWAAIIFQNVSQNSSDQLAKIVKYKIRMDSISTHDTAYYSDSSSNNYGPAICQTCNRYFLFGFIYLQDMLEKAIIEMKTNQTHNLGITAQMTPYPCWIKDKFITKIIYFFPLCMTLSWTFFVSMTIKDIVQEKEKRMKEFLRLMGLNNLVSWLAWFISTFLVIFCVVCLLSILVKYGNLMGQSNIFIIILLFTCFSVATISQCFLISIFFNKANLAAVVGGIIYFITYLPFTVIVRYASSLLPWHKMLFSLSSTVALGLGVETIGYYEIRDIGIQWSNFNKPILSYSLSLCQICSMLIVDSFIYILLTLYIECIAPGEYGLAKPWYFIFKPFHSIFCCSNNNKIILDNKESSNQNDVISNNDSIEIIPDNNQNMQPGIEIENLNKVYSRGNNHALKGLTIKFYKNEITAFLGHNGAGKSTTMHLLTGLYTPTSGTAKINGLSITNSMNEIRKSLGFVPQHNILFDLMTVKEHIWFYSRLKGLDNLLSTNETNLMLEQTGLEFKKNELSKNLSGGQQRKLSVAIAFCGSSKTVILDEPSAGVDPSGRRDIWDMLLKFRTNDRTILISTHHMDEADVLGYRILFII